MTLRVVFCPKCGSGNTWFIGYEDGYEDDRLFGLGMMWQCEPCGQVFEIEEADQEWDSSFDAESDEAQGDNS